MHHYTTLLIKFKIKKILKNHISINICRRAFCLVPNERELLNLLTLSILYKASISQMRCPTFAEENENHDSLEYVKKSETDFDFFPRQRKKANKALRQVSHRQLGRGRNTNRSPKGNMWSAIPVALLCMVVNRNERKQGSGPVGDEVL